MVSKWSEHCDERVTPIRQGKNAELVKDVGPVGDRGEQLFNVVFIDALWKEDNDLKEPSGIGSKFLERWGG